MRAARSRTPSVCVALACRAAAGIKSRCDPLKSCRGKPMLPVSVRFVLAVSFAGSVLGLCPARPLDEKTDAVTAKLLKARDEYAGELKKFNSAVTEVLDKRETAARKAGNKKELDEVKAQREAYAETGELPPRFPTERLTPMRAAVAKFDKAHAVAIKEFLLLKEDAAAETVEKERQRFALEAGVQFGKRTYLAALKPFEVKVMNGWFTNNGTILDQKIKKDDKFVSRSIFMHPSKKIGAQVKYTLGGKYLAFHASVGVPTVTDTVKPPADAVTFEVLGDGKSLWKSEPISKLDTFQTCLIRIEKVKVLTLLVHCPGSEVSARTVWFEPIVIE